MSNDNRSFQLRMNPLTGESEWIIVEDSNNDLEGSSLPANTSYLDMLNDSRRNRAYRLAIENTITQPCHVLDIGAGTGLLSMMAARAMKEISGDKEGKVSACESYLPMGKLMRKVLHANQMEKSVKVFHKRSDELNVGVDLDSRADVLVSEILDSELLGEGLIPTLQHAHDMLLTENPNTVPYLATIYGQLVESTYLWKLHDLFSQEVKSDEIHLTPNGLENILCTKPKQYAMHCNALSKEILLLSEPFKVFDFELWKRPVSYEETEMSIKATADGMGHALISWWVLQLDSQGSVFYSTAPKWISSSKESVGDRDWCDHWKQCVWFIPGSGVPVSKDSDVLVKAMHDDITISYAFQNDISSTAYGGFKSKDFHLFLPPERVGVYGDEVYRSALSTAVKNAVWRARPSPFCVVTDDSVFLTLSIASFSKTSDVMSLLPGLEEKGSLYLQAVANANGFSMDRVKVLGKKPSCLLTDNSNERKIDVLIGEPFYSGNEGMLPWQNLRFWKERTMLDSILADDAVIMPYKGILKACAMSLPVNISLAPVTFFF